jgi:NitT/TauT family transport system ATP-binding protein
MASDLRSRPSADPPATARLSRPAGDAAPGEARSKIQISGLKKQFMVGKETILAIDDVSLDVKRGEFIVVVGPSGCGKTTLLRIVDGLETASAGAVRTVHEDESKPLSTMIFQEHAVFPWMTVRDNIDYGLRMRRVPRAQRREIVARYVEKMGLRDYATAYPYQLSGGMKQRVSIARTFANDPEILCMDEPFASLDEQNKAIMQEELMRIWSESRKTALFITHSLDEAITLADRVVVMTARPGRIAAIFDIPFPRPRRSYEIRRDPQYGALSAEIWEHLRREVMQSRGGSGA